MAAPNFCTLDEERPALLPPGDYRLRFSHFETKVIFKKPKLFVWFTIATFGEHFGKRVPRYYGLRKLMDRAGKNRRFAVGWKSDFLREYTMLFGLPSRLDRIAMTHFERGEIIGRIRTVTSGSQQREIPTELRYSVVDALLKLDDGKELLPSPSPVPIPLPPPT
jgi:hypothetical protein